MKKKLLLMMTVLFLAVGCSSKKADNKTYTIGLDDTFAPMGFKDESGEYTGFDIELAKAVAKEMGVTFEFKSIDWNSAVMELTSNKIDLIWNGMTITPERQEKMAISQSYFEDTQSLYVLEGSSIKNKQDLKDKVVGLQLGSSAQTAFEEDAISSQVKEVVKYQDNVQALLDLKAQRLDAVVVDSVVGDYYISKEPGYVKLEDTFAVEYFGIGARKKDEALIKQIESAIQTLKDNGTYQKIYDKWFASAND